MRNIYNHREAFDPFIFLGGMEAIYDVFLCLHTLPLGVYVGILRPDPYLCILIE